MDRQRAEWMAILGLTLLAFVLRLIGLDESLVNDEVATFRIVADSDLDGVLAKVRAGGDPAGQTELTPPLSYVLAWLAVQFGEPTVWLRVPSLVLGTATVPLVYLLGRRTVGSPAAVLAAALLALSPFALFYANEARAYATMVFFVVLSTLALLNALETRRRRWWVLYAVCSLAVIYTHYSGIFVLVAQAAWALWAHRERIRELLVVHIAMVAGYLPWVPFYFDQRAATSPDLVGLFYPISVELVVRESLKVLPGVPHVPLRDLPGKPALAVFLLTLGAALVAFAFNVLRRRVRPSPSKGALLVVVLAATTPVAILAYSLIDTSLYLPRNLIASLPAILLLVAALLVRLPRELALVASALVVASLSVGTVQMFEAENRKPAYKAAARFIDAEAAPGDPVLERTITFFTARAQTPRARETSTLRINFKRPHLFFGSTEQRAWKLALQGRTVFVVGPEIPGFGLAGPPEELDGRVKLVESRTFAGRVPVSVYAYSRGEAAG